jgi:hypothetical protein
MELDISDFSERPTKRELFAAMAMQSILGTFPSGTIADAGRVANGALCMADALLSALKEKAP